MKQRKYRVWKKTPGEQSPGVSPPSLDSVADSAHNITPVANAATGGSGKPKYRVWRASAPGGGAAPARAAHLSGCRFYPVACVPDLWICESDCTADKSPVSEGHPNYAGDGSFASGEYGLNLVELRDDFRARQG